MYDIVETHAELRQGDLFQSLPWPAFDPNEAYVDGSMANLAEAGFEGIHIVALPAESAPGVIVSADCDATRKDHLLIARVRSLERKYPGFESQNPLNKVKTKVKVWKTQGIFYLAPYDLIPDSFIEVSELQVLPRAFLLAYRNQRIATLTEVARIHLREKVSYFLTRYGADETYFLSSEEMQIAHENGFL